MPQSSPSAAATASDMDKNSGPSSSSASSGSSKGQQPPRSASAGPAGESKPKSGKGGLLWRWAGVGGRLPLRLERILALESAGSHPGTRYAFYYGSYLSALFHGSHYLQGILNEPYTVWFTCILALVLETARELGAILIPILRMRKQVPRGKVVHPVRASQEALSPGWPDSSVPLQKPLSCSTLEC